MSISLTLTIAIALAALLLLVHNIRMMRALKRSARGLLDELSDGIVILSEHADRAWCNGAARTMLSLSTEGSLPPGYHHIGSSKLLAEICEGAAAARWGSGLPPIELIDGK